MKQLLFKEWQRKFKKNIMKITASLREEVQNRYINFLEGQT